MATLFAYNPSLRATRNLYWKRRKPVGLYRLPSSRLEDRIRELCARAIASEDAEFPSVLLDLRSVLRQHIERIRILAVRNLARERPRGDETGE